jgi:hypothetical protein
VGTINASRLRENTQTEQPNDNPTLSDKSCDDARLYIGPSNSFSFLKEASANIDAIPQPWGDDTQQSARSELQYLSSRLATAEVETQTLGNSGGFHVPTKVAGYRLISSEMPSTLKDTP